MGDPTSSIFLLYRSLAAATAARLLASAVAWGKGYNIYHIYMLCIYSLIHYTVYSYIQTFVDKMLILFCTIVKHVPAAWIWGVVALRPDIF